MAGDAKNTTGANTGSVFQHSFADISKGLFGESDSGTKDVKGTTRESIEVDEEGIFAMIEDTLEGQQGLAQIFTDENVSGLYDSTVAKEQGEELIGKISGELAKIKQVKVTDADTTTTSGTKSNKSSTGKKLLKGALAFFA